MRSTAIVRRRSPCAASPSRSAVASTAPSARRLARPRRRSSRKACMPPASTMCASLAARARQPTMAMKSGISGAATSRIAAATHE